MNKTFNKNTHENHNSGVKYCNIYHDKTKKILNRNSRRLFTKHYVSMRIETDMLDC